MSIEVLKQELSALDATSQRQVMAFLVSLQMARDDGYRQKLAEKIGRPASDLSHLKNWIAGRVLAIPAMANELAAAH